MVDKKIHWSFWIICVVGFVWNLLGAINFVVQMNPDMHEAYRETERLIIVGRPIWATLGFAIAVFAGVLGCILLLLKKTFAFYLFIASLASMFLTMGHTLNLGIVFSAGEIIGIIIMPVIVSFFLIWYSKLVEKKGWIN